MKLPVAVIIPARCESSRLPGKPLLRIGGKYILQHVHERAVESAVGRVVIATDDERIMRAAEDFGAEVLMTATDAVKCAGEIPDQHAPRYRVLEAEAQLSADFEQDFLDRVRALCPPEQTA